MRFKEILFNSIGIIVIALFVILIGVLLMNTVAAQRVPDGTVVGENKLGGLSKGEANTKLEAYYADYLKNRTFTVKIDSKTYNIPLNEISARMNKELTTDNLLGENSYKRMLLSVKSMFNKSERVVNPVIECDPILLSEKLTKIKEKVDRKPINAQISISDQNLIKKAETYGITMKMDDSVNRIKKELAMGNIGPIEFQVGSTAELLLLKPRALLADIDKVDVVLSQVYSVIETNEFMGAINAAAKAINNIFIPGKDIKAGVNFTEFSFVKCLEMDGFSAADGYNNGVNQVASTLLNALQKAGVNLDSLEVVDEADKGFLPDVKKIVISGNTSDFKFRNVSENPLVIMSEVVNNKINISVIGKKTY